MKEGNIRENRKVEVAGVEGEGEVVAVELALSLPPKKKALPPL